MAFLQTGLIIGVLALSACCIHGEESSKNTPSPEHEVTFELGSAAELVMLYSYPNSDDNDQSLEETLEHYLIQCIERDLVINGNADVTISGDKYHVTISGDSDHVTEYNRTISTLLQNGLLAVKAVTQLKKDNIWNNEEWRLFLPHGLAISNHRSVQLLHFPPDYSLSDQNYLGSKTSQRWEELLKLNNVPSNEVTLYESILDIAPIAAPSSAGKALNETYSYFEPYVLKMILLLVDTDDGYALPIVAYGGPVRRWVSDFYHLEYLGVNKVDTIQVTDTLTAPILGANHPSYIWYAKDVSREKAFNVMEDDLVSACWQARMGTNPQQDSSSLLQQCKDHWEDDPMTVCVNMEIQAYGHTEAAAKENCKKDMPSSKL